MLDFYSDITLLMGKQIQSEEVLLFLNSFGSKNKVQTASESLGLPSEAMEDLRWVSYEDGLEIHANEEGFINTVYLFAKNSENEAYQGSLPFNLDFSMTREQAIAKIGKAPSKSGSHHDFWSFEMYNLTVQFDRQLQIRTIGVWLS